MKRQQPIKCTTMDMNVQAKIIRNYARIRGLLSGIKIEDDKKNMILLKILSFGQLPYLKKYEIDGEAIRAEQKRVLAKCRYDCTRLLTEATKRRGGIAGYMDYLKKLKEKTGTFSDLVRTKSEMVAKEVTEFNEIASKMAGEVGKMYADVKLVADGATAIVGVLPGGAAPAFLLGNLLPATVGYADTLVKRIKHSQDPKLADILVFKGSASTYGLFVPEFVAEQKGMNLAAKNVSAVSGMISVIFAIADHQAAHKSFNEG